MSVPELRARLLGRLPVSFSGEHSRPKPPRTRRGALTPAPGLSHLRVRSARAGQKTAHVALVGNHIAAGNCSQDNI
jgi:hypothetical protein